MALPSFRQWNVWVDAEGQGLALAFESKIETPVLPAIWDDMEVQPAGVEKLPGAESGFGAPNLGFRQHVWVSPCRAESIPHDVPIRRPDCPREREQ